MVYSNCGFHFWLFSRTRIMCSMHFALSLNIYMWADLYTSNIFEYFEIHNLFYQSMHSTYTVHVWKCYIVVEPHALVVCLIYEPLDLGPPVLGCIRQTTCAQGINKCNNVLIFIICGHSHIRNWPNPPPLHNRSFHLVL